MYGGVRWEYCLEEWGAKSYFWGVLSKGVRRDIIGVSIELLLHKVNKWVGSLSCRALLGLPHYFVTNRG